MLFPRFHDRWTDARRIVVDPSFTARAKDRRRVGASPPAPTMCLPAYIRAIMHVLIISSKRVILSLNPP